MRFLVVVLVAGCGLGEVDSEGPTTLPTQEDLTAENGIRLANGLNLSNGATLPNGATLANGLNLANGLQFANGLLLSNGMNLANGVVAPDGVLGPYIFPSYCASATSLCVGPSCTTVTSCANSDLTKWIDANPTNNLLILQDEVQCALAPTVSVRVNYRGTLYTWTGVANLGGDWQAGTMSTASQERVSSCLLARVNASGEHLTIDMFGPMAGFNTCSVSDAYFHFNEATFFGNLFVSPPQAYVVPTPGFTGCDTRACKTSAGTCILTKSGTCDLIRVLDSTSVSAPSVGIGCGGVAAMYTSSVTYNGYTWNYPISSELAPAANGSQCTFTQECLSLLCDTTTGNCRACVSDRECPNQWNCVQGSCTKPRGSLCNHCK